MVILNVVVVVVVVVVVLNDTKGYLSRQTCFRRLFDYSSLYIQHALVE